MNQRSYVKAVAKRLTCSKARRDEFVRDLESDIAAALAEGETWEQIERRMGDPRDVAREFNEDLSDRELAAGKKRKRLKMVGVIAAAVVVAAAVLVAAAWWVLPKAAPVGATTGLDEQVAVERAKEIVTLLDADDFEALHALSDDTMAKGMTKEKIDQARAAVGENWGAFVSFGTAYATDLTQGGVTGTVVSMAAVYENATVVYQISLKADSQLIGIYFG